MKRQRHFVLTLEPFDMDILVCLCGSKTDAVKRYLKMVKSTEQFEIDDNERSRGVVVSVGKGQPKLLWLHENAWAGTVAHECFHAAYVILSEKETPLTNETEEVYAYTIQWLFNRIVTRLDAYRDCDRCLKKRKKNER